MYIDGFVDGDRVFIWICKDKQAHLASRGHGTGHYEVLLGVGFKDNLPRSLEERRGGGGEA